MLGISRRLGRRAISFVLALALGLAPVLPGFAAASMPAGDTPHAVHEGTSIADMATLHADHGKAQTAVDTAAHKDASCDRHDHHDGHCCATCVQCFTATPGMPAMFIPTYSPRLSAVSRLHDRLVVAAHDRPPAV